MTLSNDRPPRPAWPVSPERPAKGHIRIEGYGTPRVATIWQRLAARLVDGGLYVALFAVLVLVTGARVSPDSSHSCNPPDCVYDSSGNAQLDRLVGLWALTVLIGFCYEVAMVRLRGQTLGKCALGIMVVRAEDGGLLTLRQAAIRQAIPGAGLALCLVVGLFLYATVIFDSFGGNQTLADRAAQDFVIVPGT